MIEEKGLGFSDKLGVDHQKSSKRPHWARNWQNTMSVRLDCVGRICDLGIVSLTLVLSRHKSHLITHQVVLQILIFLGAWHFRHLKQIVGL